MDTLIRVQEELEDQLGAWLLALQAAQEECPRLLLLDSKQLQVLYFLLDFYLSLSLILF